MSDAWRTAVAVVVSVLALYVLGALIAPLVDDRPPPVGPVCSSEDHSIEQC